MQLSSSFIAKGHCAPHKLDDFSYLCYNTCIKCVEVVMSGSYNLLKNTWIYMDIRQEVVEEIQQRQLVTQRHALLAIVQARFPRTERMAKRVIERVTNPERLQEMVMRVGMARTEREARLGMSDQARV